MTRLEDIRDDIEHGRPVDWPRVAALQALDCAIACETYVAEATLRQQEADDGALG